jgi:hypothetical protein
MSKPNDTASGNADVHLIIQGKGGIGKSAVANFLAQYLAHKGTVPKCYDTDPVNASLFRFKALNANRVDVMKDAKVDPRAFDGLMEALLSPDGPFVIDTGATTFITLWSYIVENEILSLFEAAGVRVFLHVVVAGNQSQLDTLQGFDSIAKHTPSRQLVVWLNPYFGPIVTPDGKPFEEMAIYRRNADKVHGTVVIPDKNRDTFGADVSQMLTMALTFDEAIKSAEFNTIVKQRLKIIKEALFERISIVL